MEQRGQPTLSKQTPNSGQLLRGSQNSGAKIGARKGNSPDRNLRSQNLSSVGKEVIYLRQVGGWLRSSHPLKIV